MLVVDTAEIHDYPSFHEVFARVFHFPAYYGRNMDAWLDCMSSLDEQAGPDDAPFTAGEIVVLRLLNYRDFKAEEFLQCAGAVNWRQEGRGEIARLVLPFDF